MFDENGNFIPVGQRPYTGTSAFASPMINTTIGDSIYKSAIDAYKPSESVLQAGDDPVLDLALDRATLEETANEAGINFGGNVYSPTGTNTTTPWYKNSSMLGSIAGLGSAFAQLAALPSQIDYAKTQSAALKQNMATAKEEQARRNRNISAFNSFRG
jgi:hypothetical protein